MSIHEQQVAHEPALSYKTAPQVVEHRTGPDHEHLFEEGKWLL